MPEKTVALLLPWPIKINMLFSIVIPVFNRSMPLQRALASVLKQCCQDFEILVIDDGSNTEYAEQIKTVIAGFADRRIRLLTHRHNRNGAAARNTGIRQARGQYICFLDSDDEWLDGKLSRVKQIIQVYSADSGALLIHHQYANVNSGKVSSPYPLKGKSPNESVAHYSFVTNDVGGIQSSTICVSTQLANSLLFNESLRGHQDWDFCMRADAADGCFVFVPKLFTLRHCGVSDSVARSLDWRFSLNFYYSYQRYFDTKAAAYYFLRVVLRKARPNEKIAEVVWSQLFFLTLCNQPFKLLSNLFLYYCQRRKILQRVAKVYRKCRSREACKLAIWGMGIYGRALIDARPESVDIRLVLDAAATEKNNRFIDIEMLPISSVDKHYLEDFDAIVLATDRHQQAMCEELRRLDQNLLAKVINF